MGETSFGKYRLLAELGHGGMADVFLAVQAGPSGSGFRKLTVVKRLRQNLAEDPEFIAMLVDEARIAARLNHPNVVQTNEVGEFDNLYFIAMEYLDGQPMHRIQYRAAQREKTGEDRHLTKEQQCLIVADTLAGLHHAHELADYDGTPLNIVHRDVTPHNIFVTYDGQVKVVDFGIAKAAGRASETRQGVVKGKVRYMAPEQAVGKDVDRRADIFSAGVMLWEAVAGRRLWKDMDDLQIVHALVSGDYLRSPRAVDPTVPEALDAICQKALAENRVDRYATAEDFRTDIESYLAEAGKLVEARRKLAGVVVELFKDKRSEIRAVIEKQLAALDEVKQSSEFAAVALPVVETHSSPTPLSHAFGEAGTAATTTDDNRATEIYAREQEAKPSLKRAGLAAAAVAIAAALGLAVFWGAFPHRQPTTAAIVDTAKSPTIVRYRGTPATARLTIDDLAPQPIPLEVTFPRDDREHRVLIEAAGYESKEQHIKFDSDQTASFDLARVVQTTAANATRTTATKSPPAQTIVTVVRPLTPVTAVAPPPPPPPTTAPVTPTATPATDPGGTGKKPEALDKHDPWATGK